MWTKKKHTPEKTHHPKKTKKGLCNNQPQPVVAVVALSPWTSQQHDSHDDLDDDKPGVLMTSSRASDNKRRKSSSIRMETANLGGLPTNRRGFQWSRLQQLCHDFFSWVAKEHHILEIQFDLNINVPYITCIFQFHSLNLSMVTLLVPDHQTDKSLTASQRDQSEIIILWSFWHLKINEHLPNQPRQLKMKPMQQLLHMLPIRNFEQWHHAVNVVVSIHSIATGGHVAIARAVPRKTSLLWHYVTPPFGLRCWRCQVDSMTPRWYQSTDKIKIQKNVLTSIWPWSGKN